MTHVNGNFVEHFEKKDSRGQGHPREQFGSFFEPATKTHSCSTAVRE